MSAPKADLEALHSLVTRAYTRGIELDLEEEVFNPALLGSAAKFLKDNEITAEVKSDDNLAELREKLTRAAAAKREAGQRILAAVKTGTDSEP